MKLYRYEANQYANLDYDGEFTTSTIPNIKLELKEFDVIKETSKGYWIGHINQYGIVYIDLKRWISKTSKKRFAYPTKEEALNNFILRTEKRISILNKQLLISKIALNIAKNNK